MRRVVVVALLVTGCGPSLTPVEPPARPGGTTAVQFTVEFAAGHWASGDHGYRVGVDCPDLGIDIEPPVSRFTVDDTEPLFDERVWLRFDGPSTTTLSPSNLTGINPEQPTGAVITLTGLTEPQAATAVGDCSAVVVYDGNEPVELTAGEPFIP